MKNKPISYEPLEIKAERDLRKNIRNINARFNEHPDIAKLILINPILALQDIGITLSPEAKQHIMDSLRFPPGWVKRRDEVANKLEIELKKFDANASLPLTNAKRATLIFKTLKIKPIKEQKQQDELPPDQLRYYSQKHPLLKQLAEYERLKRGRILFQPKEAYDAYKTGKRELKWIKAVRFKT